VKAASPNALALTAVGAAIEREQPAVSVAPVYVALAQETRHAVDTATASYHLNRQPQTLRGWACLENGPIRPTRINGRLAWRVADLKKLLGVE
jgi:hypothetical protein